MINETHDPQLKSWVNSANGHLEFPIQNLPFAIFRRANSNEMFRAGVAIGDQVLDLDLALVSAAGVFSATAQLAAKAAGAASLALTVLGTPHIMGIFEMSWDMGAAALWFSIAHVILLVIICLSTSLWVRRTGVTSVPQLLENLFGPGIRMAVCYRQRVRHQG